jgi:hypothetical protein
MGLNKTGEKKSLVYPLAPRFYKDKFKNQGMLLISYMKQMLSSFLLFLLREDLPT